MDVRARAAAAPGRCLAKAQRKGPRHEKKNGKELAGGAALAPALCQMLLPSRKGCALLVNQSPAAAFSLEHCRTQTLCLPHPQIHRGMFWSLRWKPAAPGFGLGFAVPLGAETLLACRCPRAVAAFSPSQQPHSTAGEDVEKMMHPASNHPSELRQRNLPKDKRAAEL